MSNFKVKLKYYWIFLITLIFYCLGIIIHFIAQHGGTQPHRGREELKKATSNRNTVIDANININDNNTLIENEKYAKAENLFYFTQVTDIHMSDYYTRGSQGHFYYFLKKLIPIIEPNFLFITGDITNSRINGMSTAGTIENEWKLYRKILESTDILNKNNGTFLWDLRGNHDCFMVPEWNSEYNYFKNYSKTQSRGFSFNYETSYGSYSFVGLDGCPIVTAGSPFFGIIDQVSMDMYSDFMDKSKLNKNNKHNFVFIHFPETTAKFGKSSTGKNWEDYTKDISLLLTGHFHDIVADQIYAYHRDYLELELCDMKLLGKYRIVSVDNDVVSFTDYVLPLPQLPYEFNTSKIDDLINNPPDVFNQEIPPIVHITSPKNSRFILKTREPVKESLSSQYVRVLVFSNESPSNLNLSLYIDDKLQQVEFKYLGDNNGNKNLKRNTKNIVNISSRDDKNQEINESHTVDFKTPPLWVAKWDNKNYNDGKSHQLKVVAINKNNNLKGENTISFRLDGKSDDLDISLLGNLLLKTVLVKTLPILFGIVFIIYELIILLPRVYAIKHILPNHPDLPFLPKIYIGDKISNETKPFHDGFFKKNIVLPFVEAFSVDGIFYPLQILAICILVLPSKIGNVSRSSENISKFGGEFLYGMYGSGQWANTYDQYGIFTVMFIIIPFINTIIIPFLNHKQKRSHIVTMVVLAIIGIIQFVISYTICSRSGGFLTVLLSPFPVWVCVYSWVLIIIIEIRRIKDSNSTQDQSIELLQT